MKIIILPLTEDEEMFLARFQSALLKLRNTQQTMSTKKVAELIRFALFHDGFTDSNENIHQLPQWFENCGIERLPIKNIINVIYGWKPAKY